MHSIIKKKKNKIAIKFKKEFERERKGSRQKCKEKNDGNRRHKSFIIFG